MLKTASKSHGVVVVDIGAARIKGTIGSLDSSGELILASKTFDASLKEKYSAGDVDGARNVFFSTMDAVFSWARDKGAQHALLVGADLLRSLDNSKELESLLSQNTLFLNVIEAEKEGLLFYKDARLHSDVTDVSAVDIGGGSIQLVWGAEAPTVASAPLGTFSVEKSFQKDTSRAFRPSSATWRTISNAVKDQLNGVHKGCLSGTTLMVGSNVMADFFSSAFSYFDINADINGFTHSDLLALADAVGGSEYSELYGVFPAIPKFIHGADKLFCIVSAIAELGEPVELAATNASYSKGLLRMLIDSPAEGSRFGMQLSELPEATLVR